MNNLSFQSFSGRLLFFKMFIIFNKMTFLYIVVALVIIFDFINGFHDSQINSNCRLNKSSFTFRSSLYGCFLQFCCIRDIHSKSCFHYGQRCHQSGCNKSDRYRFCPDCSNLLEPCDMVAGASFQFFSHSGRRLVGAAVASFRLEFGSLYRSN